MVTLQQAIIFLLASRRWGAASATMMPCTLGPFNPAMLNTQLVDYYRVAPFASTNGVPRVLGLSIFYPTITNRTVATSYWPSNNAADGSQGQLVPGVNVTYEDLLSLAVPLAPPDTSIAAPPANSSSWPVLLFSPAFGDTRFLYSSLLRQVSSHGYVILSFDTTYDTEAPVLANKTAAPGNTTSSSSDSLSLDAAINSARLRAQDASFILDHVHDNVTSLIPNCRDTCMNTTDIAMFGHSIGGTATATAMLADTRIIGGLNYDGAFLGSVVERGLHHRPLAIFGTQDQPRRGTGPSTTLTNWTTTWPRIKEAPKWWLLLNNSRHYSFSDMPLILRQLDIKPSEASLSVAQLTSADAVRTEEALVAYTTAFFKSVFTGKIQKLMQKKNKKWPEVIFDSFDLNDKEEKAKNDTGGEQVNESDAGRQFDNSKGIGLGRTVGMVLLAMFMLGDI